MALKRVTMQAIADACGLSRNTVSKVFNKRGSVPEATKRLVLDNDDCQLDDNGKPVILGNKKVGLLQWLAAQQREVGLLEWLTGKQ